ncbi:MAG: ParA family protein [Fusobacterium sp.]
MEKIQKNLTLAYKTRNESKILNKAKLKLDKRLMEILQLNEINKDCIFTYENGVISLKKGIAEKELDLKSKEKIIKIIKNISVIWEKTRKDYITPLISIPLGVVNEMGFNQNNKNIDIFVNNNELIIKKGENMKDCVPKENINKKYLEEIIDENGDKKYKKRNGKVITVKVGKGGIGKTFITTQLAVGLSVEWGMKVLVITSDPQNDIIGMCFSTDKEPEYNGGLKSWVTKGEGDIIRLRPNVDFIPLEDSIFGNTFKSKFSDFLNLMRNKYDFILIDSMPMMAIDKYFHKEADKVIIPLFGDKFTVNGAVKVMEEIGTEKVLAVIFNRFDNTIEQKNQWNRISNYVEDTGILMVNPIKRLSYIQNMTANGKTIWDNKKVVEDENGDEEIIYNNKQLDEVRESFKEVIDKIMFDVYQKYEIINLD